MKSVLLEYSIPIQEFINNEDFIIKGIAISETTTHNGHKYVAEELQKATNTLIDKPLLIDHDNRVHSIMGRVINAKFDDISKDIKFEAKIMDAKIREMITDGRLNSVSIGAFAEDLIKEEDGSFLAKGIKFAELSLVAVPADSNATFMKAMSEAINLKEAHIHTTERRLKMTEEEKGVVNESEASESLKEMVKLQKELAVLKLEKRKRLEESYKSLCKEKNVKERNLSGVSDESVSLLIEQIKDIVVEQATLKSQVTQERMDNNNFLIEQSNGKYTLWVMPNDKGVISPQW